MPAAGTDHEGDTLGLQFQERPAIRPTVAGACRMACPSSWARVFTRWTGELLASTRIRALVMRADPVGSAEIIASSTVKPIDAATVRRRSKRPASSSPSRRVQTSGSSAPSVWETSKTGTALKPRMTLVGSSACGASVSGVGLVDHRSQDPDALLALADEAVELAPGVEPGDPSGVGPLTQDQQRVVEAVTVEAALHGEPLLPALRAGELCDPLGEALEDVRLVGVGHVLSSCSFDCDAAGRPGDERAAMPERSEHVLGLRRHGESPGRMRHKQAPCRRAARPSSVQGFSVRSTVVIHAKTDESLVGLAQVFVIGSHYVKQDDWAYSINVRLPVWRSVCAMRASIDETVPLVGGHHAYVVVATLLIETDAYRRRGLCPEHHWRAQEGLPLDRRGRQRKAASDHLLDRARCLRSCCRSSPNRAQEATAGPRGRPPRRIPKALEDGATELMIESRGADLDGETGLP